jgi:hypothetical protein
MFRIININLLHTPFSPARSPPNKKFVYFLQSPYLFTIDRLFLSIVEMFRINFYRVSLNFSFRNTKLIGAYVIERITTPIRNVHSLSDLALNKICFWHFITMSQSTKRRWNSGPSTPSSTSKKKKYNCKFQDEWIFFYPNWLKLVVWSLSALLTQTEFVQC